MTRKAMTDNSIGTVARRRVIKQLERKVDTYLSASTIWPDIRDRLQPNQQVYHAVERAINSFYREERLKNNS